MNQIITMMGNFGFPVVIAVYLLLRFEKKIEELTEKINDIKKIKNINKKY
ncbi:YvrJ family protein [Priestia aryabhattai]|nr:YvrJ family protein [Priestia aryabhattai]